MGRKPKYTNSQSIIDNFYSAVSDFYNSFLNHSVMQSGMKQQDVADEFGISRLKVRKILITTGDLKYPKTEKIQKLIAQGKKMEQIEQITGMKKSTINGFLPYSKGVYKLSEVSAAAERTALYRVRKDAVIELNKKISVDWFDSLWQAIIVFQNYPFKTYVKNGKRGATSSEKFSYTVSLIDSTSSASLKDIHIEEYDDTMLITGTDTKISRKTVENACETALLRMKEQEYVASPKQLKAAGAEEYLYPIFLRFGIIASSK